MFIKRSQVCFSPLLCGIWHTTKVVFNLSVIVPLAHRVTVNAGLLAPIHQSAAGVLGFVTRVFLQYPVSSIPFIIVIAPLHKNAHSLHVIYYSH